MSQQIPKINFTTICPVGVAVLHAERRMDRHAKPVIAFHNYVANGGYTKFVQKTACQAGRHNDVPLRLFWQTENDQISKLASS
jgi:hypothetical protein